jgi:hypothetical protein
VPVFFALTFFFAPAFFVAPALLPPAFRPTVPGFVPVFFARVFFAPAFFVVPALLPPAFRPTVLGFVRVFDRVAVLPEDLLLFFNDLEANARFLVAMGFHDAETGTMGYL